MVKEIIKEVQENMIGRIAHEQNNTNYVLMSAACNGNHLEIGVLHGGSLVAVAMMKQRDGYSGHVYGIDPFNGYYTDNLSVGSRGEVDPFTGVPVDLETVQKNAKLFDVDVTVYKQNSHPFPDELSKLKFASAYIDGDHWHGTPWLDWLSVKDITTDSVIFDNYDSNHQDVVSACTRAAQDPDWYLCFQKGITFWLKRKATNESAVI